MNVAFLGTGLMGGPMARRLLKAKYPVVVYNRTREKTRSLKEEGAEVAETARQAIESAGCIVLMLADAGAIQSLFFPSDSPRPDLKGRTVIQMGTISSAESIGFKKVIEEAGGTYLEAPVFGMTPQAESGDLVLMVGSTPQQFEQWKPLLKTFSREPDYVGPVGNGAALKIALNQIIASHMVSFSFSLGLVQRKGIDVNLFMKILRNTSLHAPYFDGKLPRMLKRDYSNPPFPAKHLLKDIRLALAEAAECGLDPSAVQGIEKIVQKALDLGWADGETSAVHEVINPTKQIGR